ncbi:hypothetical protein ACFPRL_22940 [Pseudoclavibacter helvolus]
MRFRKTTSPASSVSVEKSLFSSNSTTRRMRSFGICRRIPARAPWAPPPCSHGTTTRMSGAVVVSPFVDFALWFTILVPSSLDVPCRVRAAPPLRKVL